MKWVSKGFKAVFDGILIMAKVVSISALVGFGFAGGAMAYLFLIIH